jgi:transposase
MEVYVMPKLDLTVDSLSTLKTIVKTDEPKKARRALALIAASFGVDHENLARIFNKSESWVRNVVSGYQSSGNQSITDVRTSPGRPLKYNEEHREAVRAIVQEHPDWSLSQIRKEVNKTLDTTMSVPTVRQIIGESGFTPQRTRSWQKEEAKA